MQRLPALSWPGGSVRLIVADHSAVVVARAMLGDEAVEASRALHEALAFDPGLVLWTLRRAHELDRRDLRTIDEAAEWLAWRAIDAVHCTDHGIASPGDVADDVAHRCAQLALQSHCIALRAAERSRAKATADERAAHLLGLIHAWPKWIRFAGSEPPRDAAAFLPPGIAKQWSTMSPVDDATEGSVDGSLAELRSRYLAAHPGAGRILVALAARLARLRQLEERFAETLEAEKLASLAELAAGAGHEMNPPLAIISGRVQLFLQDEHDPQRRHELAAVNRQAMRIHEMIADMMLFARPAAPKLEDVDVSALFAKIVEELETLADDRQVRLCVNETDSTLSLQADPNQLAVAIRAISINALEAVGRGGHIELAASPCDDTHVAITIHDDGPGIAADVRRHLFDPFYSGRSAGRGLGFGLSKAWRIVTNHGGRIEVDDTTAVGAAFRIVLPIHGTARSSDVERTEALPSVLRSSDASA